MVELKEISPSELKERLDRGERPVVIDVREAGEIAIAPFPGSLHIPMGEITGRLAELDPDAETIVVCHHGIRSAQVAAYLVHTGFRRVLNLSGGTEAWAMTVDPQMPRY
ncbi:MAG TPA: rhodanese-like domain-containing protein [Candidatus Binataceae bacterium]|nr:rhodanese-like domain-containing protein [Candidatus Binataceae bacterium]